jgi:hypothetical protein
MLTMQQNWCLSLLILCSWRTSFMASRMARALGGLLLPLLSPLAGLRHQRPREETTVLGEPRGPKTELRMKPEQVVAAVEPGGFRLVQVAEISPYHYGAVFSLAQSSSPLPKGNVLPCSKF